MITEIRTHIPDGNFDSVNEIRDVYIEATMTTENSQRISEIFPSHVFDPETNTVKGLRQFKSEFSNIPGFHTTKGFRRQLSLGFENIRYGQASCLYQDRISRWYIGGDLSRDPGEEICKGGYQNCEFPSLNLSIMRMEEKLSDDVKKATYIFIGQEEKTFFTLDLISMNPLLLDKVSHSRDMYHYHSERFILKDNHSKVYTSQEGYPYMDDYIKDLRELGIPEEVAQKLFLSADKCQEILEKIEIITGIKPTFFALGDYRGFKIGI